jgi:hypothetical protein
VQPVTKISPLGGRLLTTYAYAAVRKIDDPPEEFISLAEFAGTIEGVEHLIEVFARNYVTFTNNAPVQRIIQVKITEVEV